MLVASSRCFRSCLYALLGSSPRSLSGVRGVGGSAAYPGPSEADISPKRQRCSDSSTLALPSSGGPTYGASDGNFSRDRGIVVAHSPAPVSLATCTLLCRVSHWNALPLRSFAHEGVPSG